MTMRHELVYVIVTVGVRKSSFRLLNRKPRSLKQNEYCYALVFETDMDAWQKRLKEVTLPKVLPPEVIRMSEKNSALVEKSTPDQVMDRLSGR